MRYRIVFRDGNVIHASSDDVKIGEGVIIFYNSNGWAVLVVPTDVVQFVACPEEVE